MAKFLYRPLAILFSIGGAMVAGTIFKQVWKLVSGEEEAPKARESEYGWREVLAAAATQGAVFGSSRRPSTAAVLRDSAS